MFGMYISSELTHRYTFVWRLFISAFLFFGYSSSKIKFLAGRNRGSIAYNVGGARALLWLLAVVAFGRVVGFLFVYLH